MRRTKYYAILSQDHPELSLMELRALLEALRRSDPAVEETHLEPGLAIFKSSQRIEDLLPEGLSFIIEIGEVVAEIENPQESDIYRAISRLGLPRLGCRAPIRIKCLGRRSVSISYELLLNMIRGQRCATSDKPVSKGPCRGVSIVAGSRGVVGFPIAGRVRADQRVGGSMGIYEASLLAFNAISQPPRPPRTLDPFCGRGQILSLLCPRGSLDLVVGLDIDPLRVAEARQILAERILGCGVELVVGDALRPPFRPGSFGSAVFDTPYGRRSRVAGTDPLKLPRELLKTLSGILERGSRISLALSYEQFKALAPSAEELEGFSVVNAAVEYVHGSLDRIFLILRLGDP